VTVEATRNWYWLYELLEELGVTVKLANARKVRLIAEARLKNDRLTPRYWRSWNGRAFCRRRTSRRGRFATIASTALPAHPGAAADGLKNKVHALLDKLGISHQFADLFGPAGRRFLSQLALRPVYQKELTNYLALVDDIERRIVAATKEIKQQLKPDQRAELLMTIPGIGHLTAYLLLNEIGDVQRFPTPGKLCAYGGLVPIVNRVRSIAGRDILRRMVTTTSAGRWPSRPARRRARTTVWDVLPATGGAARPLKAGWRWRASYW